jgi:hypothetical protein
MTTLRTLTRAALGLALATSAFAAVAADAVGGAAACAAPVYSQTQLRILDRASQGPDALRRYVGIVQPIRQTGYVETVAWIDGERDRLAACRMAALQQTTPRR